MDRSQVRWALLKISLLSLAASTWIFTSFILETRPDDVVISANDGLPPAPLREDPLALLARLPASLPAQLPTAFAPTVRVMAPIRMDVVKVGCWDMMDMPAQNIDARWVRLTGRPCQTDSAPENIEIVNTTNGYVGTVFAAQAEQMTTDFIPLQEGPNDILVKLGHGDGVVFENRLTFVKTAE